MTRIYLNIKRNGSVETLDEFIRDDYSSDKEFIDDVTRRKREYRINGMSVYSSKRCTNEWKTIIF